MKAADSRPLHSAEHWFVLLTGEDCTPADRQAFERWRAVPEHARAYEKTERLWSAFEPLCGHAGIEQLSGQIMAQATAAHRPASRLAFALAASAAAILLATVAVLALQHYTPAATYTTGAAERSTIRLDDGSQVILNAATRLTVKLDNDRRQLRLLEGEAVFLVAEDARRPFAVEAGDGRVTALGTRFQVRNETRRVTVTLLEGSIAVDREQMDQHLRLTPGDQVRFIPEAAELSRRVVDPEVVSSWTTGRLRFRSTPLAEVVEEVNRYARPQLRLGDPDIGSTPVNGSFEIGDSLSLVVALEAVLPIEAARQGSGEIVLRKR